MNRQDVYARVTQGILDRLASGVVPWRKPWDAMSGRPRNLVSGRPYSGVNAFALGLMGRSPFWLTIAQVNRRGRAHSAWWFSRWRGVSTDYTFSQGPARPS